MALCQTDQASDANADIASDATYRIHQEHHKGIIHAILFYLGGAARAVVNKFNAAFEAADCLRFG